MSSNIRPRLTPTTQTSVSDNTASSMAAASLVQPDDELDLFQLIGVIWRGKWIIMFTALIAAILGGYYAFFVVTPKFATSTHLVMQAENQNVINIDSVVSGNSADQSYINTEIAVIQSRKLLRQVAENLGLEKDAEFNAQLRPKKTYSIGAAKGLIRSLFGIQQQEKPTPNREQLLIAISNSLSKSVSASAQKNTHILSIRVETSCLTSAPMGHFRLIA